MATNLHRRAFLRLLGLAALSQSAAGCGLMQGIDRLLATEMDQLLPSPLPVTPASDPTETASPMTHLLPTENLLPAGTDLASPLLQDNPPLTGKDPGIFETWQEIPLQRLTGRDFFGQLTTPLALLDPGLLQPGHDYLLSFYVRSAGETPAYFWMRPLTNLQAFGHGPKMATDQVRRVWQVLRALEGGRVTAIQDPAQPLEVQGQEALYWLFQGSSTNSWQIDLRLGGFALQDLGDSGAALRSGVAVMGDSTTEGFSAGHDHPMSHEWSTHAAARLNVPFYNRAHHGWATWHMIEDWDERITPLAPYCRYCILQGGLNDLAIGFDTVHIQENFQWMWSTAEAQGMLPLIATITPYNVIANSGQEGNRQALNEWIRGTFPRVLDFDAVVRDPSDPSSLRKEDGWFGDGGHFDQQAKLALGEYVAGWEGWELPAPA